MTNKQLLQDADLELLEEFDKLWPPSTGTALEMQKYKMTRLQIESVLRQTKTMVDIDRSNKKVSDAVIGLALIQIGISITQIIFEMIPMDQKNIIPQSIIKIILFSGFVIYMFASTFKKSK